MKTGEVAQLPRGAGRWFRTLRLACWSARCNSGPWSITFQVIPYCSTFWPIPCLKLLPSLPHVMWWPSGAVFITGTPGIGKSSMLLYILWQLAKAKAKVILHMWDVMLLFSG